MNIECNMNTYDKFYQEPYKINLPSGEMAIVPEMIQNEDTTEGSQVTANKEIQVLTNPVIASSTPVKTRHHNVEALN